MRGILGYTPRHMAWSRSAALLLLSSTLGCGASASTDASDTDTETDVASAGTEGTEGGDAGPGTSPNPTTGEGSDTTPADGSSEDGGSETSGVVQDECEFTEDFEGVADGDPWPTPWFVSGGVALADIQGGRGRLRPTITNYSLARMGVELDCTDVDVSMTFQFTDGSTQGAGFYARTNGGYLRETDPTGAGYVGFAEAFRDPSALGVWREVDGQEQRISSVPVAIEPNVDYRLRFRVTQQDASTTLLQTKMWRLGDDEPAEWMLERTDDTVGLQNAGGGIALDAWSSDPVNGNDAADLLFDDVVVTRAE